MIKLPQLFKKLTSDAGKEALRHFVQNLYWGEDLTPELAKRNLEEGLVEIVQWDQHVANGLLVTKNGFFVTSNHCLSGGERDIKIRTSNGGLFKVGSTCLFNKEKDIALAKAKIPGPVEPMRYKYFDIRKFSSFPSECVPMVLMARREGKVVVKGGYTRGVSLSLNANDGALLKNLLLQEVASEPGDSGGAIASIDGRLMGIHNSKLRGEKYIGLYTAWYEVLKLISRFYGQ